MWLSLTWQCDIHVLLWERDLSEGVHILQQNNSRGSLISSGENQFWEVHFTVTLPTLCITVWVFWTIKHQPSWAISIQWSLQRQQIKHTSFPAIRKGLTKLWSSRVSQRVPHSRQRVGVLVFNQFWVTLVLSLPHWTDCGDILSQSHVIYNCYSEAIMQEWLIV